MKKMMVAVCAVALAAVAQAASVDWSVTKQTVKDEGGNNLLGAMYYIVNTSDASWDLALLADGTVNAGNIASQGYYVDSAKGGTTTKTAGAVGSTTSVAATIKEGVDAMLAYVIFTDDSKYFVSGAAKALGYDPTGSIETEGKPVVFDATSYASSLSSGWQVAEAVPEPTSALLLLLGMAGLALKRKHA